MLNNQNLEVGNAKDGGKSNVNIKNVSQNQAGMLNNQQMNVGNAQ